MPERKDGPVGSPTWIELWSPDVQKSLAFYKDLFGWDADDPIEEFGGYINVHKDGRKLAGAMQSDGSQPPHWAVYLRVADARQAEKEGADGGAVVAPAMAVADLSGAAIGGWQNGTHTGFEVHREEGTPNWFELHTTKWDEAREWYARVFGMDTHVLVDQPGFRYAGHGEGDDADAGMMDATNFMPEGGSSHWAVYFHTDDTQRTVARVKELGGTVTQGPDDTPYGVLTVCQDPTGVEFRLQEQGRMTERGSVGQA
jgi:predicted enzyme related to lactoylglutathione lyase